MYVIVTAIKYDRYDRSIEKETLKCNQVEFYHRQTRTSFIF